jgi:hypothetical protein
MTDIEVADLTTSWNNRTLMDVSHCVWQKQLGLFDASHLSLWTSNVFTKQTEIRESHRGRDPSASNETFTRS